MSCSLLRLLLIFVGLACCVPAFAQDNGQGNGHAAPVQNDDNGAQNAAPVQAPVQNSPGVKRRYAPLPVPFYRGNQKPNNDKTSYPVNGWYLSLIRLAMFIGLFTFWVWSSAWVDEDSGALKVRSGYWNGMMLLFGAPGLLIALCMPMFLISFFVIVLSTGFPLGAYILERNSMVPESAKVLTRDHIKRVLIRKLAMLGIRIGGRDDDDTSIGPDIKFIGKTATGRVDDSRAKQVESSRGFMAAKELVYDGLIRRATDIHMEPREEVMNVRMRIDGVMYPVEPFDRALGDAVVNIFKVLGAMDITEKRRSLDGSFRAISEGRDIDFRVATQGTRSGEKLSLRILDQSSGIATITQLGFRKNLQESLLSIVNQPHGMLLVCGPTGAGKSTTLYAALKTIDAYQHNIITVEDPVEYQMDNITQIEINTKAGQTFATSLRSILRQDPDIIMIGEIRDKETAQISCQAANTGHMVFSTIHANDSITALYRMIDLGVEPFLFSSSVSGILAQRLARRLCSSCKQPYRPKAEFLRQANLPPDRIEKFYRPPKNAEDECPACGGLGYRGRVGVFEFLEINAKIAELIRDTVGLSQLKSEARKNGMLYMQEEGLRLVVKGVTSIEELLRVVK
jgi:type II secretory ATPase GspE/PulE/Tfp pilus assembly ATPase PilB-like protein